MNITLFYGEDIREEDANDLQAKVAEKYPDCEVRNFHPAILFRNVKKQSYLQNLNIVS